MYDFSCIDFETASSSANSACSVSMVAVRNLQIVKQDYFLIKPVSDFFHPDNIRIHGITPEMVNDCDRFPAVFEKILPYFEQSNCIIAHNADFDMNVLHETAAAYDLSIPNFTYLDSINLFSQISSGRKKTLPECCKFFNIPYENHHNALSDATACANLVIACVEKSGCGSFFAYIAASSGIKPHDFYGLTPHEITFHKRYEKVPYSSLTPTTSHIDPEHPLYNKHCVITGALRNFGRTEAAQMIVNAGGTVAGKTSGKTDILILGVQDKNTVGADGMSGSERLARELIQKGKDVKIIDEEEFLKLLGDTYDPESRK